MKKYYYYLSVLMACSSLMTNAMEEQKPREKAMIELHLILRDGFKPKHYLQYEDQTSEDRARLGNAKLLPAMQQDDTHISALPTDVILYHILSHLDGYTLLRSVALTCPYFNRLSKMSCFTLTDCSLALAPTVPPHLLRLKIESTNGGLLKAAQSPYVSSSLLVMVLEGAPIKPKVIEMIGDIPTTLDECVTNFNLTNPKLKIAFAIHQLDNSQTTQLSPLFKALASHPAPRGMHLSGNKLRLLSLQPARPGIYYDVLEELWVRRYLFNQSELLSSQEMEVISRELIWQGRQVECISNLNFENNPSNRELGARLLEWCLKNNQLGSFRSHSTRISVAMQTLGCPDFARKLITKVFQLPNTLEFVRQKLEVINGVGYFDTKESSLLSLSLTNQFCEDFCEGAQSVNKSPIWGDLFLSERFTILPLMMRHVEKRQQAQQELENVLIELRDGKLKVSDVVKLIDDLAWYKFPEEAGKLISYILSLDVESHFAEYQCSFFSILDNSIHIDRENSIVFLKKIVDSEATSIASKLGALEYLSHYALPEVESYVVSQMEKVKLTLNSDELEEYQLSDICKIYSNLTRQENRDFYFQKWVETFIENSFGCELKTFQDAGFKIDKLEDLLRQDPIKVLNFADEEFDDDDY